MEAQPDVLDAALLSAQRRVEEEAAYSPLTSGIVKNMSGEGVKTEAFGSPAADMATPNKQLDFGMGAETPATPVLSASTDDDLDYYLFIKETFLWTNKIRSFFYFAVGLLVWLSVRAIFKSETTLPTGICYMLLASLFFNFLRAVMAPKFAERCMWSHSAWTQFAAGTANAAINATAAMHDHYLNGRDPLRTLEVGLALWVLSLLGRALDAVSLLLLLHLAAFSVPALYNRFQRQVDAQVSKAYAEVKAKYDSLPRKIKATAVGGLLVVLAVVLPTIDRLVVIGVLLVYGRAILSHAEYASLAKRVEPVAAGFKAVGDKATTLAVSTINKYELTPTPLKKKNK